jgi:hypothetical protein
MMNKSIYLVLILILTLSGCSDDSNQNNQNVSNNQVTNQPIQRQVNSNPFVNGQMLLTLCQSDKLPDIGACQGYIMAVNDTMIAGHLNRHMLVCMPKGVNPLTLKEIVTNYLKAVPAKLGFIADGIVAEALANNFPCR